MKKITLLVAAFVVLFSCSKEDPDVVIPGVPVTELPSTPIAEKENDTVNLGVYRGVVINPSGYIEVYLKHKDTITKARLVLGGKEYIFKTTESNKVVRNAVIEKLNFVSGAYSFNFSVSEKGKDSKIEDLKIDANSKSMAFLAKETSKMVVKGYEGQFEGNLTGNINFITYGATLKGLVKEKDSVFSTTIYGYHDTTINTVFGSSAVLGDFSAEIDQDEVRKYYEAKGTWLNKTSAKNGTFRALRTF